MNDGERERERNLSFWGRGRERGHIKRGSCGGGGTPGGGGALLVLKARAGVFAGR